MTLHSIAEPQVKTWYVKNSTTWVTSVETIETEAYFQSRLKCAVRRNASTWLTREAMGFSLSSHP